MSARFLLVGKNLPAPFGEGEKELGACLQHCPNTLCDSFKGVLRTGSGWDLRARLAVHGVSIEKVSWEPGAVEGWKWTTTTTNNAWFPCTSIMRQVMPKLSVAAKAFGSLRRIWSLGALGEGSSWDLRVRPVPVPGAASANLGIWKSQNLDIWEFGNQQNPKLSNSHNQNIRLPKMSVRSGSVGTNIFWPFFRPFQTYSHGPKCKNGDLCRIHDSDVNLSRTKNVPHLLCLFNETWTSAWICCTHFSPPVHLPSMTGSYRRFPFSFGAVGK